MPFLILFAAGLLAYNPDHWNLQVMFGMMGVSVLFAHKLHKKTHLIAGVTFAYFAVSALWVMYLDTHFHLDIIDLQWLFNAYSARSFAMLLCVCIPFIYASTADLYCWGAAFTAFAVVDSFYMIFQFASTGAAVGMIGQDSIDGSFLAIFLPLMLEAKFTEKELAFLTPVALALLLAKSSTVYGILCIEGVLYLSRRDWRKALLIPLAAIPLGYFYLGRELLNDNGRRNILETSASLFRQSGQYLTGLGTSSFIVLMPLLQTWSHKFAWLHNEPGQVLFEQGVIGLVLLAALYATMLWRQRKNEPLFTSLMAAGFASFLQPCFRYFIFAVFMAFLARISFEKDGRLLL